MEKIPQKTNKKTKSKKSRKSQKRKAEIIKEINLPMRFNTGYMKFVPDLPVKISAEEEQNKKIKKKINWKLIAWLLLLLLILFLIESVYFIFRK